MNLFINYRHEDTLQVARHLHADLGRLFSKDDIFLDHARLEGGEHWPEGLRDRVRSAHVVLAVVGDRWLTVQDKFGSRRLDDPEDWVRQELVLAMERRGQGTTVIPVLIDDTAALAPEAFRVTPQLQPLAGLQIMRLR